MHDVKYTGNAQMGTVSTHLEGKVIKMIQTTARVSMVCPFTMLSRESQEPQKDHFVQRKTIQKHCALSNMNSSSMNDLINLH